MTDPPPATPRRGTASAVAVTVGVTLLVLLVLAVVGVGLVAVLGVGRTTVERDASATSADRVVIEVPSGAIDVRVGAADEVRAELTGSYWIGAPTLAVETAGGVTTVTGGCPTGFPSVCSASLTIEVPAASDLEVHGTNGAVTVTGVDGDVSVATTNGRIEVDGATGRVDLATTNGEVTVRDARVERLEVRSVNGSLTIEVATAPERVIAQTTNGSIAVTVPAGDAYSIEIGTVNGSTDVIDLVDDPSAARTIDVSTVNGSIEVRAR